MAPSHDLDLPKPDHPLELVCLKDSFDVIRARVPPNGPIVVVRTGTSRVRPVPAELFTIQVEHSWVFGHTRYVKGLVTEARLDVARLELVPLGLQAQGLWDPEEHDFFFEDADPPIYREIRAAGPRPQYEMEQVLPDDAVELHWEEDPILEAVELDAAGGHREAMDLLGDLLTADLRCLDAHAHLGNFELHGSWPEPLARGARHYRAGLEIAGLSLGPRGWSDFPGVLPWGLIDNRPFLRCLHGYGLALWRQGDAEAATRIFRRMLWLNPGDNQGARFLLAHAEAGGRWEELYENRPGT